MTRKLIFGIILIAIIGVEAMATHLRAGNITAVRISETSFRYRFTLLIYRDTDGVEAGNGVMDFGDGRIIGGRVGLTNASEIGFSEKQLGSSTSVITLVFEHTFQNEGNFIISYTEGNRNVGIINLGGGASGNFAFHIETMIRVSSSFFSSTPQLTVPPLDRSCIGSTYFHNPGAFDVDGDSLAYRIVTPLLGRNSEITDYLPLNDPSVSDLREDGGSPAAFSIDPVSGTLTWDAPQFAGEYSVAFVVEEWRKSEVTGQPELIGFVTRDMQIVAETCTNNRPDIILPADTCLEALSLFEATVTAVDVDNDQVLLEAFGGSFQVTTSPASFLSIPDLNSIPEFRDQPAQSLFTWQTTLNHIREQPYEVVFRVTDRPADRSQTPLTDFETMSVRVVAPAPTGLRGDAPSSSSIELKWDNYSAALLNPVMQVYRRVDSFAFTPEGCNVGIPPNSGYQLIDELPINQTTYIDDDDIQPGVNYCYRLVASFPLPNGGTSYASQEFCLSNNADVPSMVNVSVNETSTVNGEILTRWNPPIDIDPLLFPPPYRYELFRYNGFTNINGRTLVTDTNDTTFIDSGLNTLDEPYNYQVRFYDADDNLIDSSATASSVRLNLIDELGAIRLAWQAEVPWSNSVPTSPFHYIYRNRTDNDATDVDTFELIDSVNVIGRSFRYLDDGSFNNIDLFNDREYCYFVITSGSYGNPQIPAPLINNSQINCARPKDDIPPEEPEIDTPDVITIEGPEGVQLNILESESCQLLNFDPCEEMTFSNTINWSATDPANISHYNIYFSASGEETSYALIGTSPVNSFTHSNLPEIKGCYKIAAVDFSDNESELSNNICFDNCPYYELPNTFTPNEDGINETFRAFDLAGTRCSRFVQSVVFRVYDRWGGQEIFSYNSEESEEPNIFIDWKGTDNSGVELPTGTYYYIATVTFNTLNPANRKQEFRNWVKIIR